MSRNPEHSKPRLGVSDLVDDDLIKGWKFSASMYPTTPLEYLLRHGEVSDTPKDEPPAFGIWMPILKSWKGLGIPLKDANTMGEMASAIGLISTDGGQFLPFLIKFRRIVESELDRVDTLVKLTELEPQYPQFTARLGGDLCKLFVLPELQSLVGCGKKTAQILYKAGYLSKAQVVEATVDELTSIPGIGRATAKRLKGLP